MRQQDWEAAGHIVSAVRKQRERRTLALSSLSFYSVQDLSLSVAPLIFRKMDPCPPSAKYPHRYTLELCFHSDSTSS